VVFYEQIISGLASFFNKDKPVDFSHFVDNQGNFEIFYPKNWRYDGNIAFVDGKYTISFQSPDNHYQFTIAVDTLLPKPFDFSTYAKTELESPSSGVYTPVIKSIFHGMEAYTREYAYASGSKRYAGGGVMFFTGNIVFSLSWSTPENKKQKFDQIIAHMLKTITVRNNLVITQYKQSTFDNMAKKGRKKL
jgi:hypothetical protein